MSYTAGQIIGMLAAIPLLVLLTTMLVASTRVFVIGGLRSEMRAMLVEAIALRTQDGLEPLSEHDRARLSELRESPSARQADPGEVAILDAAVVAFAGKHEPAFAAALAREREDWQQRSLHRLRAYLDETPHARDVLHRWRWWEGYELACLLSLGFRRLGLDVLRRTFLRGATASAYTAGGALLITVAAWVCMLPRQPRFFDYLEFGGTTGGLVGLGIGVISVFKGAWAPYIALVPAAERHRMRVCVAIAGLWLVAVGPCLYFNVPGLISDGLSTLGTLELGDQLSATVGLVVFTGAMVWVAYHAWRRVFASGSMLSERMDHVGAAIMLSLIAVNGVVLSAVAQTGGTLEPAGPAFVWPTILAALASVVAWIGARVVGRVEARRRTRQLLAQGLEPAPIRPVWMIVLGWFAATFVVSTLVVGGAFLVLFALGLGPKNAADVAAVSWMGSVILCLLCGWAHVAITKLRLRRDERRLIGESRAWLRSSASGSHSRSPGDEARSA